MSRDAVSARPTMPMIPHIDSSSLPNLRPCPTLLRPTSPPLRARDSRLDADRRSPTNIEIQLGEISVLFQCDARMVLAAALAITAAPLAAQAPVTTQAAPPARGPAT